MSTFKSDIDEQEAKSPSFSAYTFFDDNSYEPIVRWVNLEQAQKTVEGLLFGAAAAPVRQISKRIIITDGGDNTVFEWQRGKGITWPTPEDVRKYRESKISSTGTAAPSAD